MTKPVVQWIRSNVRALGIGLFAFFLMAAIGLVAHTLHSSHTPWEIVVTYTVLATAAAGHALAAIACKCECQEKHPFPASDKAGGGGAPLDRGAPSSEV